MSSRAFISMILGTILWVPAEAQQIPRVPAEALGPLVSSSTSQNAAEGPYVIAPESRNEALEEREQIRGERLDIQGLLELFQTEKPKSVDEALALLPESYRSQYALMYESASTQKASFESPRVIMHNDNVTIAFNGDPSLPGYGTIEVIGFDYENSEFEFREVSFKDRRISVSDKNPESCKDCHRRDLRPNWDHYLFWKGAFGANDNQLSPKEQEKLAAFKKSAPKHPIYRHLAKLEESFAVTPSQSFSGAASNYLLTQFVSHFPNSKLQSTLTKQNFRRIAHQIKSSPDYTKFKYAIVGALMECEDIESFLPQSVRQSLSMSFSQVYADTQLWYLKRGDLDNRIGKYVKEHELLTTASLRYLLENRGISMKDWSLDFSPGYNFTTVNMAWNDIFSNFSPDLDSNKYGFVSPDCKKYKSLSLSALSNYSPEPTACVAMRAETANAVKSSPVTLAQAVSPVLVNAMNTAVPEVHRCITCHTGKNAVAPLIPFDDPKLLGQKLKENDGALLQEIRRRTGSSGEDRMPPREALSPTAQTRLIEYLESL